MEQNYIKRITEYKNIYLVNTHNDYHILENVLLNVEFENGTNQILDTMNNQIVIGNYWKLEKMKKTKENILYETK